MLPFQARNHSLQLEDDRTEAQTKLFKKKHNVRFESQYLHETHAIFDQMQDSERLGSPLQWRMV